MSISEQMKNQYDETTKAKAEKWLYIGCGCGKCWCCSTLTAYREGRDSAKGSLEILAKLVRDIVEMENLTTDTRKSFLQEDCEQAISKVKARGDWPIEETVKIITPRAGKMP